MCVWQGVQQAACSSSAAASLHATSISYWLCLLSAGLVTGRTRASVQHLHLRYGTADTSAGARGQRCSAAVECGYLTLAQPLAVT